MECLSLKEKKALKCLFFNNMRELQFEDIDEPENIIFLRWDTKIQGKQFHATARHEKDALNDNINKIRDNILDQFQQMERYLEHLQEENKQLSLIEE